MPCISNRLSFLHLTSYIGNLLIEFAIILYGMTWTTWLTPDTVLACLFPFAILIVCFKVFPSTNLSDLLFLGSPAKRAGPFSLQAALKSYASYPTSREKRTPLAFMRKVIFGALSRTQTHRVWILGYPKSWIGHRMRQMWMLLLQMQLWSSQKQSTKASLGVMVVSLSRMGM